MQYMLLLYGNEAGWAKMSEDEMKAAMASYAEFNKELAASGVLSHGEQLRPSATATTLRVVHGKVVSTDGPFAEAKEQVGGYYVLDTTEADAIAWASKCPAVYGGAIEVRALVPRPE